MRAFARILRAEWTKFRTVPGWVISVVAAGGLILAFGLLPGMQGSCGQRGPDSECVLPVGPEGEEVTDRYTFVHRTLAGDGSITVRVTALTGELPGPNHHQPQPGVAPWAKAGLIIRSSTDQGASYAAVMVTGVHGVRMQYDYTHDIAGSPSPIAAATPRWLRLTRTGDTVTAAESADGNRWTTIGAARLPGLPATVEAGLFVTSPDYAVEVHESIYSGNMSGPSQATGTFDQLAVEGAWDGDDWRSDRIGAFDNGPSIPDVERDGEVFRVTGSGDIAPAVPGAAGLGTSVTQTLAGTFIGLIVVVVIGAVFVTAEYRRGLIRSTLAASPGRVRVLAAKAIVVGAVMFATGLVAAAIVVHFGQRVLLANGVYVHPASTLTELRIVVGTAALLALAGTLALGLGALFRRSVTAVTTAVVIIVLPYLLAMTVLPSSSADWLLRISPAAAFALQQAAPEYPQVANVYTPVNGYFPLPPWAGFAVLAGWAALALTAAAIRLRRRDA
ncbi:MAG TPA: ABC transporter permease subunit [Jiangellales bacterium]|nr:ABC transporter permease subunit [Jiangellales bacterium]